MTISCSNYKPSLATVSKLEGDTQQVNQDQKNLPSSQFLVQIPGSKTCSIHLTLKCQDVQPQFVVVFVQHFYFCLQLGQGIFLPVGQLSFLENKIETDVNHGLITADPYVY